MNKYLLLTKILMKSGLGDSSSGKGKKKAFANTNKILLYGFILICFSPLMIMIFSVSAGGYHLLKEIGQEGIIIDLIVGLGGIVTFIFGMTMVLSVFYFTGDIENLLPLPLKPSQIVGAKFTVTLFYDYVTSLLFMGPAFLGYGVAAHAGVIYWLFAILAILMIPVVPLIYASILSMIIMRLSKGAKNKDFITILSTLFALIAALGFNAFTSHFSNMSEDSIIKLLKQGNNSLMGTFNKLFPNFHYLENALVRENVLQMLLYLVTTAVFVLAFILIADTIYLKGVIGITETTSKRKEISEQQRNKIIRRNSAFRTYMWKEIKILVRTPVYLLNCVLFTCAWPVFFLIPMLASITEGHGSAGESLPNINVTGDQSFLVYLIAFGVAVFVSSINFSTATSISREGKNFFFIKYIPMSYREQINAKVAAGSLINIIGATVYSFIGMLILKVPAGAIILSVLLSVITSVMFQYLALMVDLIQPKLNWENEQKAVKQNFNTVIYMFLTFILGGVLTVIGFAGFGLFKIPAYISATVAIILLAAATYGLSYLAGLFAEKRIGKIE